MYGAVTMMMTGCRTSVAHATVYNNYGTVQFSQADDAEKAVGLLHGNSLQGSSLDVTMATVS